MIDLQKLHAKRDELQAAVRKAQEQQQQCRDNITFFNGGLTLLNELISEAETTVTTGKAECPAPRVHKGRVK